MVSVNTPPYGRREARGPSLRWNASRLAVKKSGRRAAGSRAVQVAVHAQEMYAIVYIYNINI